VRTLTASTARAAVAPNSAAAAIANIAQRYAVLERAARQNAKDDLRAGGGADGAAIADPDRLTNRICAEFATACSARGPVSAR